MDTLLPLAARAADLLKSRKETITIAESSAGGLISASLLSVPGASAYFLGGGVIYTRQARSLLMDIQDEAMQNMRASTEAYAVLLARTAQRRFSATWALSETGATGPKGNRYGDASGHACFAVVGPKVEKAITLETASEDRIENMRAFGRRALDLLLQALESR